MVLEATMICIDNSEWMRNGDVAPSRMDAQLDAVNLLCNVKLDENPENAVGLLTLAGTPSSGALWVGARSSTSSDDGRPRWLGTGAVCRVLITQTRDPGRVLTAMHQTTVEGEADLVGGLQKAQLALKHRQNKNQRQRIICFVASPVAATAEELVQLGRALKKNNVAVDVVLFGSEWSENEEKMKAFIASVNVNDNAHLVIVPPGTALLAEALMSTPLIQGEHALMTGSTMVDGSLGGTGTTSAPVGSSGMGAFPFDPNADPELALALQMSLEEERNRQAAAAAAGGNNTATTSSPDRGATVTDTPMGEPPLETANMPNTDGSSSRPLSSTGATMDTEMGDNADELDEELRLAIELSKQEASTTHGPQREAPAQPGETEKQRPETAEKKEPPKGS
ncbi:hypothetical protein CCYA_CCYA04G1340 [Cyanidiococcus yangmingshanensis]|nr:hypothetical protein CCYA_CCYA04G1340 [Cyanidiococcus yangmingshanensis]